MIFGDERRMKQIFFNLIRNALKFTHRHGRVIIKVCYINGFLVANVVDTGAGIATEDFPKLLKRFGKM